MSGDLLVEMMGHTALVYAVAAHKSGIIASGSEDCSAKIWKGSNPCNLNDVIRKINKVLSRKTYRDVVPL
jgi:WD40 repeat protein